MNKSSNLSQMPYVKPIASTQQDVSDYLLGNPRGITFIHGKAGSGKTYLIRKLESAIPAASTSSTARK